MSRRSRRAICRSASRSTRGGSRTRRRQQEDPGEDSRRGAWARDARRRSGRRSARPRCERLADPKESPVVRLAAIKLLQQKQIFSSVAAEWRPAFVEALRAAVREPKVRAGGAGSALAVQGPPDAGTAARGHPQAETGARASAGGAAALEHRCPCRRGRRREKADEHPADAEEQSGVRAGRPHPCRRPGVRSASSKRWSPTTPIPSTPGGWPPRRSAILSPDVLAAGSASSAGCGRAPREAGAAASARRLQRRRQAEGRSGEAPRDAQRVRG